MPLTDCFLPYNLEGALSGQGVSRKPRYLASSFPGSGNACGVPFLFIRLFFLGHEK